MVDFTDIHCLLNLIGGVVILAIVSFVIGITTKKSRLLICSILFSVSLLVVYICRLEFLIFTILLFYVTFLVSSILFNLKTYKDFFSKTTFGLTQKKKIKGEALFDRDAYLPKIVDAVTVLSKKRIGALITFERKDNLDDYMKSGTMINSPINSELIQTIFYPGTRLHDGAIIIRLDKIAAASVYFTPTSKPLTGKFGSRHRAALGISENTDAVTIVVSEETGRISITTNGELEAVTTDILLERLNALLSGNN